jgi:hypothetical protein
MDKVIIVSYQGNSPIYWSGYDWTYLLDKAKIFNSIHKAQGIKLGRNKMFDDLVFCSLVGLIYRQVDT